MNTPFLPYGRQSLDEDDVAAGFNGSPSHGLGLDGAYAIEHMLICSRLDRFRRDCLDAEMLAQCRARRRGIDDINLAGAFAHKNRADHGS